MSKRGSLTPVGVATMVLLCAVFTYMAYSRFGPQEPRNNDSAEIATPTDAPSGRGRGAARAAQSAVASTDPDVINVCINTWGGYAGGLYMNGGLEHTDQSRFQEEFGVKVRMILEDDVEKSRQKWQNDECDVLWTTADSFPTESGDLIKYRPKIFMFQDWSRGGDAVIVSAAVKNVANMEGKRVALASGSPSETLLFALLDAGGLGYDKVQRVSGINSALMAANAFREGKADVAIVWAPDDQNLPNEVDGAHVLMSTKNGSHLIADVLFAKSDYLREHPDRIKALTRGWLSGNAMLNASNEAMTVAANIMVKAGMGKNEAETLAMIKNTRLATYGDNLEFFGLNADSQRTGEDLYTSMGEKYKRSGKIQSFPSWASLADPSVVKNLGLLARGVHEKEKEPEFSPTLQTAELVPMSSLRARINFAVNSDALDERAIQIIERQFLPIASRITTMPIRVEGYTDSTGNDEDNRKLSERRAQAIVNYLVKRHKFPSKRFDAVGMGEKDPVENNATEAGRALNRRTEFQLLTEKQ